MEIKGFDNMPASYTPPVKSAIDNTVNTVRDSFTSSTSQNIDDRMNLAAKLLFGDSSGKSSEILQTAALPGGEKAMLSRIKIKPPGINAEFVGNLVPGENNSFFLTLCRKDQQGNFNYSLAQLDSTGKIVGERTLFSKKDQESVINLSGGNKNCVCLQAGETLYISPEGKPVKEMPVNSAVYARVRQSEGGTVFFLDQNQAGSSQDSSGKLIAIGPDGEVKWKRQTPVGELSCSDSGSAYIHTKYKNLYEFSKTGEVDDLSNLYEQDHSFSLCAAHGDSLAVVRTSSHAGDHDTLTVYKKHKEAFRFDSAGMINTVKYEPVNSTHIVMTGEWRKEKLTALDDNGNTKWDMELPEKGLDRHSLLTDDKGNIIITMEIGEHTDIPDSFKTLTKNLIKTNDLKEPGSLLLVISPDGAPVMAHKDKEENGGRAPKRVFSDGTIAFTSTEGNIETITRGDKAKQVFEELTKPEPITDAKKPEISINQEAGEVNIGGVKLPIGKKPRK
jgi:outer membrane protein assembly factor BamB